MCIYAAYVCTLLYREFLHYRDQMVFLANPGFRLVKLVEEKSGKPVFSLNIMETAQVGGGSQSEISLRHSCKKKKMLSWLEFVESYFYL